MLTPDQYYDKALEAQGLIPNRQLEKVAEKRGIAVETAKLAQTFWNKLTEDGISYSTPETHAEDAVKLAEHYVAYRKQHIKTAAAKADALAAGLKKASAQLIGELKLAGMSPEQALQIGSAQADAEKAHNDALPLKRDALIGGDGAVHQGASDALTAAGSPPPADIKPEELLALIEQFLSQHPEWANRDQSEQPGPGAAQLAQSQGVFA